MPRRQPPTSDTPPDTNVCGPCVWIHQPKQADKKTYEDLSHILDTYLEVMHNRFIT